MFRGAERGVHFFGEASRALSTQFLWFTRQMRNVSHVIRKLQPNRAVATVRVFLIILLVLRLQNLLCEARAGKVVYRIDASLDTTTNTISATQRVMYTHAGRPVQEVVFNLMPNYLDASRVRKNLQHAEFFVDPTEAFFASDADFGRIQIERVFMAGEQVSYTLRAGMMMVDLPAPLHQGETVEMELEFRYYYPKVDFGYTIPMNRRNVYYDWFPQVAPFDERKGWLQELWNPRCDFEVRMTLPESLVAVFPGKSVATAKGNGLVTHTLLVRDVPTFAFVISRDYRMLSKQIGTVRVNYYYLPYATEEEKVRESIGYLPAEKFHNAAMEILTFFEQYLSEYPYQELNICEVYDFRALGGAAGAGAAFPGIVAVNRFLAGFDLIGDAYESILAHEIAHQWFGVSLLSDHRNGELMISESFAMNLQALYMESKYGRRNYYLANLPEKQFKDSSGNTVLRTAQILIPPIIEDDYYRMQYYNFSLLNEEQPLTNSDALDNSVSKINGNFYIKGHYLLSMLRDLVGDTTYQQTIRVFYAENRLSVTSIDQFLSTLERIHGDRLTWFFTQWFDGQRRCDYEVKGVDVKQVEAGYNNTIRLRRNEEVTMPFEYELILANGKRIRQRTSGTFVDTTIVAMTESPVDDVLIDPEKRILDSNDQNNRWKQKILVKPLINPFDLSQSMMNPFDFTLDQLNYWGYPSYDATDKLTFSLRFSLNRFPFIIQSPEDAGSLSSIGGSTTYLFRTNRFAYTLDVRKLVPFPTRNSYVQANMSYKERLLDVGATVTTIVTDDPFSSWFTSYSVAARHTNLKETSYYPLDRWERGIDNTLGFTLKVSRRISDWFPIQGFHAGLQLTKGLRIWGGAYSYLKTKANVEYYIPLAKKTVLALNVVGGTIVGSSPKQALFELGRDGNMKASTVSFQRSAKLLSLNLETRFLSGSLLHTATFLNLAVHDPGRLTKGQLNSLFGDLGVSVNVLGNSPFAVGFYVPLWSSTPAGGRWRIDGVAVKLGRIFEP